jgi:hypothetical protein
MVKNLARFRYFLPQRILAIFVFAGLYILPSIWPYDINADIAPMEYSGYSFAPSSNADIRMTNETVDIYVGDRISSEHYVRMARVVADFEMTNESADTISLNVGFPVEALFLRRAGWDSLSTSRVDDLMAQDAVAEYSKHGMYDFKVSVNGGEIFAPGFIKTKGQLIRKFESDYLWYGWQAVFPPGPTRVRVENKVRTNYMGGRGYQNLHYVLYSGSFWKGTIGKAVIRVHPPDDAGEFVLGWVTPGNSRQGKCIVWEYEDFEPGPQDNIRLLYLPFDAQKRIEELEKQVERNKRDADARTELARVYLGIAFKGAETGQYPDLAKKAEILLQEVVEIDPKNALAWNIYLTNVRIWLANAFPDRSEAGKSD